MQGFGARQIIVGIVLLAGSGVYVMANQKTDSELQIEQLGIDIDNTQKAAGYTEGAVETRSAVERHKQFLQRAYWPAGLGAVFLVIGWAAFGNASAPSTNSGTKSDEDGERV